MPAGARAKLAAARDYLAVAPKVVAVAADVPLPAYDDGHPGEPAGPGPAGRAVAALGAGQPAQPGAVGVHRGAQRELIAAPARAGDTTLGEQLGPGGGVADHPVRAIAVEADVVAPRPAASCRSGRSSAPRISSQSGSDSRIRSTRPWLKTASSSPSTWATLTAGRSRRCRALAAVALVLKLQVACRKWPSSALIRGSPRAVTVATVSTFMPVSSATRSAAVSTRSWLMMLRRCSVDVGQRAVQQLLQGSGLGGGLQHGPTVGRRDRQSGSGDRRVGDHPAAQQVGRLAGGGTPTGSAPGCCRLASAIWPSRSSSCLVQRTKSPAASSASRSTASSAVPEAQR